VIEIVPVTPSEFAIFDQHYNYAPLDDKVSRSMLSGSRVAVMSWGVPCLGLKVNDELVSLNVTNFSKRPRKNAWGRYLNCYLAYTRPEDRRKGYATKLMEHIEEQAIVQGYSRMKSLAGSYLGVRLHMRMGHQFWGVARFKKGELIVDTPLKAGDPFPEGIPIEARGIIPDCALMSGADLTVALQQPPFNVTNQNGSIHRYMERRR